MLSKMALKWWLSCPCLLPIRRELLGKLGMRIERDWRHMDRGLMWMSWLMLFVSWIRARVKKLTWPDVCIPLVNKLIDRFRCSIGLISVDVIDHLESAHSLGLKRDHLSLSFSLLWSNSNDRSVFHCFCLLVSLYTTWNSELTVVYATLWLIPVLHAVVKKVRACPAKSRTQ